LSYARKSSVKHRLHLEICRFPPPSARKTERARHPAPIPRRSRRALSGRRHRRDSVGTRRIRRRHRPASRARSRRPPIDGAGRPGRSKDACIRLGGVIHSVSIETKAPFVFEGAANLLERCAFPANLRRKFSARRRTVSSVSFGCFNPRKADGLFLVQINSLKRL